MNAKTKPDLNSLNYNIQCKLMAEILLFAQILVNDKEASDMLSDALNAGLCQQINDQQLNNNFEIVRLCSSQTKSGGKGNDEGYRPGAVIPIEMLKLLSMLKDHSRIHKELYWRTLEVSQNYKRL